MGLVTGTKLWSLRLHVHFEATVASSYPRATYPRATYPRDLLTSLLVCADL